LIAVDANRQLWNRQQKELRQALTGSGDRQHAIQLFLSQHAMVHSAVMSQSGLWSCEDELWHDISEEIVRRIPRNCEHSIAWIMYHIARIEDVTMNLLVAGSPQLVFRGDWIERMKVSIRDTGNGMDDQAVADLSLTIDIEALRAYRVTVGRRTRQIVTQLQPEELKHRVDPSRLQRVRDEGAVVEAASAVLDYWSRRTIAGLLLMPPTRHCFLHLNEAQRLKHRRR
jgi:hypothetical protein